MTDTYSLDTLEDLATEGWTIKIQTHEGLQKWEAIAYPEDASFKDPDMTIIKGYGAELNSCVRDLAESSWGLDDNG